MNEFKHARDEYESTPIPEELDSRVRAGIRQQHRLVRTQDFGAFPHKGYPGKNQNLRIRIGGLLTERKGIPHHIRNLLHRPGNVVMRQNQGIALLFQGTDFFLYVHRLILLLSN